MSWGLTATPVLEGCPLQAALDWGGLAPGVRLVRTPGVPLPLPLTADTTTDLLPSPSLLLPKPPSTFSPLPSPRLSHTRRPPSSALPLAAYEAVDPRWTHSPRNQQRETTISAPRFAHSSRNQYQEPLSQYQEAAVSVEMILKRRLFLLLIWLCECFPLSPHHSSTRPSRLCTIPQTVSQSIDCRPFHRLCTSGLRTIPQTVDHSTDCPLSTMPQPTIP